MLENSQPSSDLLCGTKTEERQNIFSKKNMNAFLCPISGRAVYKHCSQSLNESEKKNDFFLSRFNEFNAHPV